MVKIRVCDFIAQFIEENNVKDVFLLSGGGIIHLLDGLACNQKINVVCCHHEQAASIAMDAYARVTGKVSVGFFTTGPGATNAITGCAGAWLDSVPCIFISGQAKRKEATYNIKIPALRQVGVQEINILPMVKSITKYSVMVNDPEEIQFNLEKALYMAKEGRPGPVWLDIPLDVQSATVETETIKHFLVKETKKVLAEDAISTLEYLGNAKKPVILAGQGVRISGAMRELVVLTTQLNIPIVTSYLGIDVIDSKSPYYIGRVGIKGDRAGNLAVQQSDLLIVLGSSLPIAEIGYEYDKFAPLAKKIVVDIDLTSHKKSTINIDLLIESDIRAFLSMMIRITHNNFESARFIAWKDTLLSFKEQYPVCLPEYAELKDKVNIYYFINTLSEVLNNEDIMITDAGSAFYAGSQAVQIKEGMRYITSGGFATMGFSLPASIGACVAADGKRIMCINNDSSFQQNSQELQTIVHYNLPIKIFVLNNEGYLSIKFTQKRYFEGRLISEGCTSGVTFPDTAKIAAAYGIPFYSVNNNIELHEVLNEILEIEGPVICEIMTPPDQEIISTDAFRKNEDCSAVSESFDNTYPLLPKCGEHKPTY